MQENMPKETNQAESITQQTLRKVELLVYGTIWKEENPVDVIQELEIEAVRYLGNVKGFLVF